MPDECVCYNLVLHDSKLLSAVVATSSCALYSFALKGLAKRVVHTSVVQLNKFFSVCLFSSKDLFVWHSRTVNGFVLQQIDGSWIFLTREADSDIFTKTVMLSARDLLHHCHFLPCKNSCFGINKRNDLVVNGCPVIRHVGSYSVDKKHLLTVTFAPQTASSKLQIFELEDILKPVTKEFDSKRSRAVERGALLIGHETGGCRIWMQMPRGNLETIYLRQLQLRKLKELLDTCCFREAAVMMKKHRIDMNLFYDHNPEHFMGHIGQFVDDLNCAELLNLFITSLNDKDVTMGMYSDSYNQCRQQTVQSRATKVLQPNKLFVQLVCTAVREHILSRDESTVRELYTTVISTYLKENPPQISKALLELRKKSLKFHNGIELEKKWTAFVSMLAPAADLFRVALQTYDLNLALAVAQNLQMVTFFALCTTSHAWHIGKWQCCLF
ncbi:unnamed protein product [Gongylonema pulchrum]|uniref:CNH domain-containing protein n=1 Tax=Gongylonema pulchrum TaxID=637853 RepID=A0A183E3K1_9BILA|nr:unnamed protein product [Gongylonema pulchrum]